MAKKLIIYCVVIVILFSFVQTAPKIKRDGEQNSASGSAAAQPAAEPEPGKKEVDGGSTSAGQTTKTAVKPTDKPATKNVIDNHVEKNTKPSAATPSNNTDCENTGNCTGNQWNNIYKTIQENKGMLMRTFYVLIGVTTIVVVYFVVRAWRMRRRRSRSRKYGIITTRGSDMEMEPLENEMDDDDEDMTVFEQNGNRHR